MRGKARHAPEQDFELNIAPIIDCFVVLIAYLLISASFISLTSMDVQVAVPALGTTASAQEPTVEITIDLDSSRAVKVKVSGAKTESYTVAAKAENWDFDGVREQLETLHGRFPAATSVIMTAAKEIEYSHVVKMIEAVRPVYSQMALGERDE